MVKSGNVFLFILLFLSGIVCANDAKRITLQLLDMNGQTLEKVGKRTPFVVQVAMYNISQAQEPDFIPGFEHCKVQKGTISKSHRMQLGGPSEQIFTIEYLVVVDVEQEIVFGPCVVDGIRSNAILCKVVAGGGHVHQEQKTQPVMMKINVPHRKYVVGQRVPVHITTLQQRDINFSDIGHDPLVCNGCKIGKTFVITPAVATEKIGEIEYIKEEYVVEIYPQNSGHFIIPPLQGYYIQNYKAATYSFWLPQPHQKIFHSNSIEFTVDPLPRHSQGKKIQYIGIIDGMFLKASSTSTQVGKALTISLWVQGNGNLESIDFPELQLPEHIKMYQGTSQAAYIKDTMTAQRTFEYALQFTKPGDFTLPVQEFTYFDPQAYSYKTIQFGENISFQVEPSAMQELVAEKINSTILVPESISIEEELGLLSTLPIKKGFPELNHFWIVFLFWCIIAALFLIFVYKNFVQHRFMKKLYVWMQGWNIKIKLHQNNIYAVRLAWRYYLRTIEESIGSPLSGNDLYAYNFLQKLGMPVQELEKWKIFYNHILQATYDNEHKNFSLQEIKIESKKWIKRIQGLLWKHMQKS